MEWDLSSGLGVSFFFTNLKASDYLLENTNLSIAGIKYGLKGKIIVNSEEYNGVMLRQGLDDEEVADVMNYILNEWGNQTTAFITPNQVSKIPKSLVEWASLVPTGMPLRQLKRAIYSMEVFSLVL